MTVNCAKGEPMFLIVHMNKLGVVYPCSCRDIYSIHSEHYYVCIFVTTNNFKTIKPGDTIN